MLAAKMSDKIFQNKTKAPFWGHFCTKKIFPKSFGQVQLVPQNLDVNGAE